MGAVALLFPLVVVLALRPGRSWQDDVTLRAFAGDHVVDGRRYSPQVVEAAAQSGLPLGWFAADDPNPFAHGRAMLARMEHSGPPQDLDVSTLADYRQRITAGGRS